jgi:hypothetical protein
VVHDTDTGQAPFGAAVCEEHGAKLAQTGKRRGDRPAVTGNLGSDIGALAACCSFFSRTETCVTRCGFRRGGDEITAAMDAMRMR